MPDPVIKRGRASLIGSLLLILLATAGCAGSAQDSAGVPGAGSPDSTAPSGAGLLPAAEGTTEYPLTLRTWAGETVLEERPERVAVIGFSANLDAMQAIGAVPVYALSEPAWEWRDPDWLAEIEFVDDATRSDPLNYEAIAVSEPDVIVAANFIYQRSDFERLSEIAPVIENAELGEGDEIDWPTTQRMIGEALDLSHASEQVITDAKSAIADTASAHPEFSGKTITMAYDYGSTPMEYYSVADGTVERFVQQLGFAANPRAEEFVDDPVVSDERLGLLDADALVVFYSEQSQRERREGMRLFQSVPAVADDRYVAVVAEDPESGANATWVLRRGASAVSLPWAAEVIADSWLTEVELR